MNPIEQATSRLNETITEVEQWLASRNLGVYASIKLDAELELSFEKDGKLWRLLLSTDGGDASPLVNSTRRIRMLALQHIPELLRALERESADMAEGAHAVCDEVFRFMKETK